MSRSCPECGDTLIKTADGGFMCIQCGWAGDEDDAPAATGSPLDIHSAPGEVKLYVPDPRRGMDTFPYRMDADSARRLAEALEQAADDADRREDREPMTDGGRDENGGNPHGFTGASSEMDRLTVRLPEQLLEWVEDAVERGEYPSRSEAIRAAIRNQFVPERPPHRVRADGGGVR